MIECRTILKHYCNNLTHKYYIDQPRGTKSHLLENNCNLSCIGRVHALVTLLATILANLIIGVGQARLFATVTTIPLTFGNIVNVVAITFAISNLFLLRIAHSRSRHRWQSRHCNRGWCGNIKSGVNAIVTLLATILANLIIGVGQARLFATVTTIP
jgi:hypothetical protein